MGGKSSKGSERRHVSSYGSAGSSSSWDDYEYPQSPNAYPQQNPYHTPLHHRAPAPFHDYSQPKRKLDRRYSRIADDYHSLDEVIVVICLGIIVFFVYEYMSIFPSFLVWSVYIIDFLCLVRKGVRDIMTLT